MFVPTLTMGGAERHAVTLRGILSDHGFETSLVAHGSASSEALLRSKGAENPVRLNLRGMSSPVGWLKVWGLLRRIKPDLILCVNQTPLIVSVALGLAGLTHARIVGIFHTTTLQEKERSRFFLFSWALKFADALVYVSDNQRRTWGDRGLRCRDTHAIPNGVDLAAFVSDPVGRAHVRLEQGIDPAEVLFGLVAAFRHEKRHVDFIHALRALRDRGIRAKAVLVGDGPTRDEVQAQVLQLGLEDSVIFAGEQQDVRAWIAACDVGVLCSEAETLPLSALEFLAMGVPMVMSDVGGASEIVHDGINGRLFPAGDVPRLTDALADMVADGRRRDLSRNARSSIEPFAMAQMADRYIDLAEDLVRRNGV